MYMVAVEAVEKVSGTTFMVISTGSLINKPLYALAKNAGATMKLQAALCDAFN